MRLPVLLLLLTSWLAPSGCGQRTIGFDDRATADATVDSHGDEHRPPVRQPPDAGVGNAASCGCQGARLLAEGGEIPAIAADSDYIYWVDRGTDCDSGTGTVKRVRKCGGAVEVLATGQLRPETIALDDDRVYFFNGCGSGQLRSVAKTGGPVKEHRISVDAQTIPEALVVAGGYIYFNTYGLVRVPKGGGAQQTLDSVVFVYGAAADARGVYWTGPERGSSRYRILGQHHGDPSTAVLGDVDGLGNGITLDDEAVYFMTGTRIASVAREGGQITTVVAGQLGWRMAVDERFVYWTVGYLGSGGYTVYKAPKRGGGPASVVGKGGGAYVDLVVDERCVYVSDLYGGEIRSFPK